MAQGNLLEMTRQVQAHAQDVVPFYLAQSWIQRRYREVAENHLWSFKFGESQFTTPAVYDTGTVSLTNNSATVTGSGTTWTSAMTGRQFKVGGFVFTFTYVGATSGTLDRVWGGADASGQSYQILQAYITPAPTDFYSFLSIIDPANGWRLRTGYTSIELDRIDARRSSSGTPTVVASRVYSSTTPMFELWPHSTAVKQYPYLYEKRVTDLTNPTDTPPTMVRSDLLVMGALADLARWPGTNQTRNPFYDPYYNQWKSREAEFEKELNKLKVADQNIYMTDLTYYTSAPYAPIDSKFIQNHAY